MDPEPNMHDLAQQIARLAETMVNWKTDMAQRDAEAARRDKDNLRWTIPMVLGCTAPVIGAVALFS